MSTFVYNSKTNSFQECDRTVYNSLRFYPEEAQYAQDEALLFGAHFENENGIMLCQTHGVCSIKSDPGSKKAITYFQPKLLQSELPLFSVLYQAGIIKIEKYCFFWKSEKC